MIKFVSLMVALLVSFPAFAGYASAVIGGGATKAASGSWSVKGASATAANGSFITPATVTSSGRQITMPASASFAANAASFAVTAVRLNPTALVLGAVVPWLAAEGLQWANNTWTKTQEGVTDTNGVVGFNWRGYAASPYYVSADAACAASMSHPELHGTWYTLAASGSYVNGVLTYWGCNVGGRGSGYSTYSFSLVRQATCFSGYTLSGGVCVPNGQQVPATEADFDLVGTHALPSDAAQQLARADVPIPVNDPVLAPSAVDSYGTPYLDALTGRMMKDLTRVTPDPTPDNPLNVRVDSYAVDAGAVPGQTTAPEASTTKASNIDFPSDYARQGEAQSAADSINSTLGPKLDKIVETGADPADPSQPQGSEFDQAFFQGTFTNLLGWQLPAHTSQCPTSSFTFNSASYTVDSHCQLVANHFSALSAVMSVVWTIFALFILLGA